jgi:hypothetical protein
MYYEPWFLSSFFVGAWCCEMEIKAGYTGPLDLKVIDKLIQGDINGTLREITSFLKKVINL